MRPLLALLALVCLVAGCVGPTPATEPTDQNTQEFPSHADLEAPAAAVADHGPATREESDVTVTPGVSPSPGYTARQTITIRNSLEGFPGAVAKFSTPGGGLAVHDGEAGSYEVVVELRATALTESDARAALATLHVDTTDAVQEGTLQLAVIGRMDPRTPAGNLLVDVQRSISMDAALDPVLAYDLSASTGGGGIDVSRLGGPEVDVESGGGGIQAADLRFGKARLATGGGGISTQGIHADELDVESGGGGLSVEAAARSLRVESGGGGVTVDFTPTATGQSTVRSGGGGVTVKLARGDGIAYDVTASSGGGGCTVDIHDAETTGSGSEKHARSRGFDRAPIQATIEASSGGGGVTVRD